MICDGCGKNRHHYRQGEDKENELWACFFCCKEGHRHNDKMMNCDFNYDFYEYDFYEDEKEKGQTNV